MGEGCWAHFRIVARVNMGIDIVIPYGYYYQLAEKRVGFSFDPIDVAEFSIKLKDYEPATGFSGLFLSALANRHPEKPVEIVTAHLDRPPDRIGYVNRVNLIVRGDAGDDLGAGMKTGSINVEGEIGSISHYWEGGKIFQRGVLVSPGK